MIRYIVSLRSATLALMLTAGTGGCFPLYTVGTAPQASIAGKSVVGGIPFYTKRAACRQQTVYQQRPYKLTLRLDSVILRKGVPVDSVMVVNEQRMAADDSATRDAILYLRQFMGRSTEVNDRSAVVDTFRQLRPFEAGKDRTGLTLASNTVQTVEYVDYSRLYFYNVRRPLIGTANAELDLNENGTLSKGTASVEDKTTSTFLDLLPVKDFLTAKLIPSTDSRQGLVALRRPATPRRFYYSVHLEIEKTTLLHTFTRTALGAELPCGTQTAIPDTTRDAEYALSTPTMDKETPAPKPSNGITVTGEISLPKKP